MANEVTELGEVPIVYGNGSRQQIITAKKLKVEIDTPNTYVQLIETDADKYAQVLACMYSEDAAHDFTFGTGASTEEVDEQLHKGVTGCNHTLKNGVLYFGALGEPIACKSSAAITQIEMIVAQGPEIIL